MNIPEQMKQNCLVLDIETSSKHSIKDFDKYVADAKTKWFGCYSYKTDKYYLVPYTEAEFIKRIIDDHDTIVSFNGTEFDIPILQNNNLFSRDYKYSIDLLKILGTNVMRGHKNRGSLMGFKFPNNQLRTMAEVMKIETQKGDIDYKIFEKESWTEEETKEIKMYLKADIKATKQLFEKTFDYWLPFSELISEENVKKWTWLTSSIASMTYKYACNVMGWTEEYGEKEEGKRDIGGRVIPPRVKEAKDVWYIDVTSLYPHIYAMFNLFDECDIIKTPAKDDMEKYYRKCVTECFGFFRENKMFKTKGYYNSDKLHPLAVDIMDKLRKRIKLKKEDPTNPLIYTYKILLNSLYGASRSPVFASLYTENAGDDCCRLGQQINKVMESVLFSWGFKTIYGDTDSIFVKYNHPGDVEVVLKKAIRDTINQINLNCPFPQPTFNIDIEDYVKYIKFGQDNKGTPVKKNYLYINSKDKIKLTGLSIIRRDATKLGPLIYEKYLKSEIVKASEANAPIGAVKEYVYAELDKDITLLAKEFNCRPAADYKPKKDGSESSHINAQISRNYLDSAGGRITLIKNKKLGKAGKTAKYCTLEEAKDLDIKDLDLSKVYKELTPFCAEVLK